MQVNCAKCSQPIALTDIIESHDGHLSHIDCKRPHVLIPEERALIFVYCAGHVVARCPACDVSYRYNELAADILAGGRTNMCPRCRQDLTETVRAHLFRCAMLPQEVQLRARAVREAAQLLVKRTQEATNNADADILIREAEAALLESRKALHAAMSKRSLN
jgi:hypothetical protein